MSVTKNRIVSNTKFYVTDPKLRFQPPALTDPLIVIVQDPDDYTGTLDLTSGDKVFVPFGFDSYDFGVSGVTVVALADGETNLTTSSSRGDVDNAITKYIFAPPTIESIEGIPNTRDALIMVNSFVNNTLLITGGDNVQIFGGNWTCNAEASYFVGNDRAMIRIYNQKSSVYMEGLSIDLDQMYGRDAIEYGTQGHIVYIPDMYFQNCRMLNAFSYNERRQATKDTPAVDKTITDISVAAEAVFTSAAHGYANDDVVQLSNMPSGFTSLNGVYGWVASATTDTYKLEVWQGTVISTTGFTPAFSGTATASNATEYTDNVHADLLQPYGKHRFMFIDRFSGSSMSQGIFDDPQHFGMDRLYSNINMWYMDKTAPASQDAGFLAYFKSDSATALTQLAYYDYYIENYFVQEREFYGVNFPASSVYPQSSSAVIGSTGYFSDDAETGHVGGVVGFPPFVGVRGNVRQGSLTGKARFGDYVVEGRDCGDGYVSPGYRTDGKPFYYDTTDCHIWINSQHFYVINNATMIGTMADTQYPTTIKDLSLKYNNCTGTNMEYLTRYVYGRKAFVFNGDGYIDSGVTTLGDTHLFADNTDEFFVYVVCECDDDGYIFSKAGANRQLGLYMSGGDLFGICRGTSTLIKEDWDGTTAFVAAGWDGTDLTYYFNDLEIVGTVGVTAEETSERIIWGARTNGSAFFWDGTLVDSRIYDRALTSSEISNLYLTLNEKWNLDGDQLSRPSQPSAPQSLAANNTVAGQISLTFSAPSSNGGTAVLDYVVRYRTAAATQFTLHSFSTVGTTTGATITGLLHGTDYVFEVRAVNAVGWGAAATVSSRTKGDWDSSDFDNSDFNV